MDNLVSICIPVYNGAEFLSDAINSALRQTYSNIEILIVDDGSNDGSVALIEAYQAKDNRIRLVINETNLGLVGNWEKCIKEAKGKWIKYLFQDDWMEPNCVAAMINAANLNNADAVFCDRMYHFEANVDQASRNWYMNDVKTISAYVKDVTFVNRDNVLQYFPIVFFMNTLGEPNCILFKKDVYAQIGGFNKDLVQLVDNEFNIKIISTIGAVLLPTKLVNFRVHDSSTSSNNSKNVNRLIHSKYIEPLIIYHELLYNPLFSYLTKNKALLYKSAVHFAGGLSKIYPLSKEQKSSLYQKYPKLKRILFWKWLWIMKKKFNFT